MHIQTLACLYLVSEKNCGNASASHHFKLEYRKSEGYVSLCFLWHGSVQITIVVQCNPDLEIHWLWWVLSGWKSRLPAQHTYTHTLPDFSCTSMTGYDGYDGLKKGPKKRPEVEELRMSNASPLQLWHKNQGQRTVVLKCLRFLVKEGFEIGFSTKSDFNQMCTCPAAWCSVGRAKFTVLSGNQTM